MILSIDIGSHKITALLGEVLPGDSVRVVGAGHAPAEGIRAGEVVHVEDAAGAIASSVDRAERLAGKSFSVAIAGISGQHVRSRSNRTSVPCGRRPRSVIQEDIARALEVAGTVPIPEEREVLHVLPSHFQVDDGPIVQDPTGMEGYDLAAAVHIVTASRSALNNLRRCLELGDVVPARLALATLCAAEATLTPDERELGVVLVDLGHAVTGVACFDEGTITHSAMIGLGGRHLTNDVAVVFQTPFAQAERLKETHGHVLPDHDDERSEVTITPFGSDEPQRVRRRDVSQVLAARVDEIADLVRAEIDQAGFAEGPPAGVVLVGGGTELSGLARRLHERWSMPVRIGRPRNVAGLTDAAGGADHAAAIGLLRWAARDAPALEWSPAAERARGPGVVAWMRQALLPRRDGRTA